MRRAAVGEPKGLKGFAWERPLHSLRMPRSRAGKIQIESTVWEASRNFVQKFQANSYSLNERRLLMPSLLFAPIASPPPQSSKQVEVIPQYLPFHLSLNSRPVCQPSCYAKKEIRSREVR